MLSEWVDMFRAAMDEEFGPRPHIVTLATVSLSGPAARSVVCRGIEPHGYLFFASDARSEKNAQIRRHGAAEVVCWLPTRREQYRIRGIVRVVEPDALRAALWRTLTDATRATFFWPAPGAPRTSDDGVFPREIGAETPPPPPFEILALKVLEVDFLDLKPHPHERKRWRADNQWFEERLNP